MLIHSDQNVSSRQILVLIDHDGTICNTNENAYDSIKYGVREAARIHTIDIADLESKWEQIFDETRGTTELFFIKLICNKYGNSQTSLADFAKTYYQARANWYHNSKSYSEYTYDTYYPDAENLIFHCWKTPNAHIAIVTGNPEKVMKERLATHLQELFFTPNSINVFGNEGESRQELIKLAIEKAQNRIPNFQIERNAEKIATNIVYIGDSQADLFAGIRAKVKTLWIPSRMLQHMYSAKSNEAIALIAEVLHGYIHITNNLESSSSLDFVFN